jgi:hypothetical protein
MCSSGFACFNLAGDIFSVTPRFCGVVEVVLSAMIISINPQLLPA